MNRFGAKFPIIYHLSHLLIACTLAVINTKKWKNYNNKYTGHTCASNTQLHISSILQKSYLVIHHPVGITLTQHFFVCHATTAQTLIMLFITGCACKRLEIIIYFKCQNNYIIYNKVSTYINIFWQKNQLHHIYYCLFYMEIIILFIMLW